MVRLGAMNLAGSFKTAFRSAVHQVKLNCDQRAAANFAAHASRATVKGANAHRFEQLYGAADRLARAQQAEMLWWEQARARHHRSPLDFSPRFRFRRDPGASTTAANAGAKAKPAGRREPWAWGGRRAYEHHARRYWRPRADGRRNTMKMFFLEAWVTQRLRYNPKACAKHGVQSQFAFTGGIGGGKARIDFDHARWKAWHNFTNRAHYRFHRRQDRLRRLRVKPRYAELLATAFEKEGCADRAHRLAPVLHLQVKNHIAATQEVASTTSATPARNACPVLANPEDCPFGLFADISTGRHAQHSAPLSGFLQARGIPKSGHNSSRGLLLAPPIASSAGSFASSWPGLNLGVARAFHSTAARQHLPLAVAAAAAPLAKILSLLKSSTALHYINILFRISVSLIPISIKRAAWARKARLAQLAAGASVGGTITPHWWHTVTKIVCRSALALPFVLLVVVLLAALEKTPITGRLRLMLLNTQEEAEIVNKVLELGAAGGEAAASIAVPARSAAQNALATHGPRDWLTIMRTVLGESNAPAGTLLGGKVLDSSDWRVHLVEDVLSRLEGAIPSLALSTSPGGSPALAIEPPPLSHPLHKSVRSGHLAPGNAVIVIDRPESNAFSFGFYGSVDQPQPGVIIVFTGAIDEIVRANEGVTSHINQKMHMPVGLDGHMHMQEPSWLRSFFGSLLPAHANATSHEQQQLRMHGQGAMITREQEEALSVLVAHELAHLVLSHTIESYANTALLWPQLEKLGWDMLRVFIYPITAILGPFVQDAISATVKVGIEESAEGRGLLPSLTSSCESKKLEFEADKVALRLLANAGIDPRSAIQFWEDRLGRSEDGHTSTAAQHDHGHTRAEVRHMHGGHSHPSPSSSPSESHSFIKTHPADQERIAAIRKELGRWRPVALQPA